MDNIDKMPEEDMMVGSESGYGLLGLEQSQSYVGYGAWAVVASIVPPLLYNLLMRGHETWGAVGYKFAAYAHFYLWLPVALAWTITTFHKTSLSYRALTAFGRISTLGPLIAYPMACYFLFRYGTTGSEWREWVGASVFTLYTLASIFGQIVLLPGLDAIYWDFLVDESTRVGRYKNDLDSDPLPDDFNNWDYLGLPKLEIDL